MASDLPLMQPAPAPDNRKPSFTPPIPNPLPMGPNTTMYYPPEVMQTAYYPMPMYYPNYPMPMYYQPYQPAPYYWYGR
jgi:hypothetical protein